MDTNQLKRIFALALLCVALLCTGVPARAALTCSNGANTTCLTSASCATAYGTNPTAGDVLFTTAAITSNAFTLTIASTRDGTWHQASISPATNGTTIQQYLWWVRAAGGGADTVTVSGGAVTANIIQVIGECSNAGVGTWTEDKGTKNTGTGTALTTGTTAATTQANEVVIAAFGSLGGTITTPTGYTVFSNASFVAMYFKIVAATGTQTAASTAVTGAWTAMIDTFFAANVTARRMTLLGVGP